MLINELTASLAGESGATALTMAKGCGSGCTVCGADVVDDSASKRRIACWFVRSRDKLKRGLIYEDPFYKHLRQPPAVTKPKPVNLEPCSTMSTKLPSHTSTMSTKLPAHTSTSLVTLSVPILTSLLASSCCVIQLLLNFLSVSCAGFAVLTPYRPLFTALTVLSIGYNLWAYGLTRRTFFALLLALALANSPEIVQLANEGRLAQWTTIRPTDRPQITTYVLQIEGISCMSCANRIKATLDALPYVTEARVFFDNSSAVVDTIEKEGGDVWRRLVEAVRGLNSKYAVKIVDSW
ncbi:hypothetical protein BC937DRAFT_88961 [Endogone sp. FLAS-F59071]|nr:hypothetical protein BC937DRAFT_88961 [Endogone sp. FLAS-F59071]|eukprot:RUS18284.1 hypothetical protein BC937DRAFT_88961 [Endogone sp. FLAS-F59071]